MKIYISKVSSSLVLLLLLVNGLLGQTTRVQGTVIDIDTEEVIDFVTVYEKGTSNATETNINGYYEIDIAIDGDHTLVFSRIGYTDTEVVVRNVAVGRTRIINAAIVPQTSDVEIVIRDSRIEDLGVVTETMDELKKLPTSTGNLESVLPHIALGASGGNGGELSSQYNVRGGNYDENLIYVNDFEIFRPQLIRSGQQEGLTFANIDLIRDLSFSSGGFEAKYGDKMSSVLDVRYKRPEKFAGSASASLLGGSAHLEGKSDILGKDHPLRILVGARYKTTQYLLNSLDVQGEYTPQFFDGQAYLTYDINPSWQLAAIGNYNTSAYNFVPLSSSTGVGLIGFALNLSTVFEGSERDAFINGMGGVSLTYLPNRSKNPLYLKFLASAYTSEESETFDILGFYRLAQVETDLSSDTQDELAVLGVGTQHKFARNYLQSQIYNVQHKGGFEYQINGSDENTHFIQWSVKSQVENIADELIEWERIDSAGYSLPFNQSEVLLSNSIFTQNSIQTFRSTAYVQDTYTKVNPDVSELRVTLGTRFSHWTYNNEFLVSPRFQVLYKPLKAKADIAYKVAGGVYYQPPFYRELRFADGSLNPGDINAQRSLHLVTGLSLNFPWLRISDQPFKFIAEAYYKKLDNLISYDIDNVKIRYSGENDASGYVLGLDMRVNGEFVPGAESWINVSILSARERLDGVQHLFREVGETVDRELNSVPRPTDRRVNVSMFFQDYLPGNERFKVQTNLNIGSGLPFGLNGSNEIYRNTFRYKLYHRVDMGFSYSLWDESLRDKKPDHWLRRTTNSSISLDVFNLMNVRNVATNTWIKTIYNTQYAIPNFLTGRRLSLRLRVEF